MEKKMTSEEVIKLAVAEGVAAADRRFAKLQKDAAEKSRDRRLHNTKLLIRNYRIFKAHAESAISTAEECEDSVFDILAMMSDKDFRKAETTVKSIQSSAARTAIMINHITAMIETYEIWCQKSGKPENERRCRVLKALYIDDNPPTLEELADREGINERTIYKDVDAATEILAALIFGIDSIRF